MKLFSTVEQILSVYGDLFIGKALIAGATLHYVSVTGDFELNALDPDMKTLILDAMNEVDSTHAVKLSADKDYI